MSFEKKGAKELCIMTRTNPISRKRQHQAPEASCCLYKNEVNQNVKGKYGITSLNLVADNRDLRELLLQQGADTNTEAEWVLLSAISRQHVS
jgi:hypothetical protein